MHSKEFESGKVLVYESNGIPQSNPNYFYINLNEYWKKFFDCDYPTEYEFMPGGHFAITKEQLRLRSKAFYGEVLSLLAEDTNSPWNIERLECYMFNPKYTSAL